MGIPDFELDIGVLPTLEIDLDGSFALEDSPGNPRSLDQVSADNLWLSSKVSILSIDDGVVVGFTPNFRLWN